MPRSDTPTTDLIDLGSWQSGSSKAWYHTVLDAKVLILATPRSDTPTTVVLILAYIRIILSSLLSSKLILFLVLDHKIDLGLIESWSWQCNDLILLVPFSAFDKSNAPHWTRMTALFDRSWKKRCFRMPCSLLLWASPMVCETIVNCWFILNFSCVWSWSSINVIVGEI